MAETDERTPSEIPLHWIMHTLSTAIIATDATYRCTFVNMAAERLLGTTRDAMHGHRVSDIIQIAHSHGAPDPFALVFATQQPVHGRASFMRKDGYLTPVRFIASPFPKGSDVAGITIELWVEHATVPVGQGMHYPAIEEQSPAGIAMLRGSDHRFVMANPAYYQLVGRRDIIGKTVREAFPEVITQGFVDLLDAVYRTGIPHVESQRSLLLQQSLDSPLEEHFVNFVYSPLYEHDSVVAGILVHVVDITETIRAQEQFALAEAHYQRLVTTAPQMIYVLNVQGFFTEINPAGEHLLGRSSAAVVGHHFKEIVAPDDYETAVGVFTQVITGHADNVEIELHIVRPSSEQRLLQITATAIWEQGQITGVHGIARDSTEERARDALMRLLILVVEQIEHGVLLMDKDFLFRFINPAAAKMLGIPLGTSETYHVNQFIPDEAAHRELLTILAQLHTTGQWSGRVRRRRVSDGQTVLFDMVKGEVEGTDGQAVYFNLFQDATKTIVQERQLRRAERLASLGTLIEGIGHELSNPLTTIMTSCKLLLRAPKNEQDKADLEIMLHEADRIARLMTDVRMSVRHTQEDEREKGPIDLNLVVQYVLSMRTYMLQTSSITVEQDLAPDLPLIYGNAGELEQVLLNLIVNAEQAMKKAHTPPRLTLRTVRTAEGAAVEVRDTGSGIAPAHLDQLFDPFFTTKGPGEGIGLGLTLVSNLVQEHGGSIYVESTPGGGALFRVELRAAV